MKTDPSDSNPYPGDSPLSMRDAEDQREGIRRETGSISIPFVKIKQAGGFILTKLGSLFGLALILIALTCGTMKAIPAFAATIAATNTTAPAGANLVSTVSTYIQDNTNAESSIGIVFGHGIPQATVGEFLGFYNGTIAGRTDAYELGIKYDQIITGPYQTGLMGPAAEFKLLRFLPGNVPPPLGIVDPALEASVENDITMPFKRWYAQVGINVIKFSFKSFLGQ